MSSINVTATRRGFYGGKLREEGDTFPIEKEADLGSWMKVNDPKKTSRRKPEAEGEGEGEGN